MVIIHAGMHKTGSTSIQHTFNKLDGDRVDIPPRRGVDCNIWFYELFVRPAEFPEIRAQKIAKYRLFLRTLERRRSGRALRPLLISGEGMSYDHKRAEKGLIAMAEYLREHSGEDVRVIAYVRPPRSFMSSWFQQKSRGTIRNFMIDPDARRWQTVPNAYWPRYRVRFEKFDTIFGRENVTLKPFQRERLEGVMWCWILPVRSVLPLTPGR